MKKHKRTKEIHNGGIKISMKIQDKKELTKKQKIILYFYRFKQFFVIKRQQVWVWIKKFVDSHLFYFLILILLVLSIHKIIIFLNLSISEDDIYSIALAIAGIIGTSIAIIFSFSTFILQSSSDLFSTQYLNKFISDTKEKIFFWALVFLTLVSLLVPLFIKQYVLEILMTIIFVAFYLIYILYKELRKRINPETTLTKIKADAIRQLGKINKELKKYAHIQNTIYKYTQENQALSLDVQYKANPNRCLAILINIKHLFEIGLRLLAKNEINSFNLTLKYIHDILLKHLDLRNGHFIRVPASIWGTYSFDDEGFTAKVLEYMQSVSERIIHEKRKENIYFLLNVYESILRYSLTIKYADKNSGAQKDNPLLSLTLMYYIGFLDKVLVSKENDWIWESVKSLSRVSSFILTKTDNYFAHSQLNQAINKISVFCLAVTQETFLKELVNIYFNQICIAWNNYPHNRIFWKTLFEELKKNLLMLSVSMGSLSLSVSDLFINFHSWQIGIINGIFKIKDENKQKENIDNYIKLLKEWSDFILDFARDVGLENKQVGLPIIQSVDSNLRIIYGIKDKFKDIELQEIYSTQFYTLSWYFKKTEKIERSFLLNLEQVFEILTREVRDNLKHKFFDFEYLVDLYIRLVEQHFKRVTFGSGYNPPRVIEKLVYLGLVFQKYNKTKKEQLIVNKINELNKKYLEYNKEYFELKRKKKNLMGADEFQLCKELHDLKNDLFSYNSHPMGVIDILKNEISKENWDMFVKKISYCKNVEYKTVHF